MSGVEGYMYPNEITLYWSVLIVLYPYITGLVADGELSTQHPVFGGTLVVTARFTSPGVGIYVIRAKSFAAEPAGGGPAEVVGGDFEG